MLVLLLALILPTNPTNWMIELVVSVVVVVMMKYPKCQTNRLSFPLSVAYCDISLITDFALNISLYFNAIITNLPFLTYIFYILYHCCSSSLPASGFSINLWRTLSMTKDCT